ncbi:MAG: methionyl-tRNA formyltransferase [Bdellovibrionales bacterium]
MSRVRALFMGTPEIARHCLETMIKDPHFEVVGVVTQPDRPAGRRMELQPSPVKSLVAPLGIPVLTPESVNQPEILEQLATMKAEVVVVVAFGQILRTPLLEMFPQRVVNVHASVLPRWRGAAPIQRALMAGDPETGVSLQIMVKKLDAGPVLGIRKIPLTQETNAFELYESCKIQGAELISVDLMDYLRGNLSPIEQDPALVTLAPKIEKGEAQIDWRRSAYHIHNQVRGLVMGPVAETLRDGKRLKIHRTRVLERNPKTDPGQVVQVTSNSLVIACAEGSLELLEVQPDSRARMPIIAYLRGYPIQVGDGLGR